MFLHGKTGVYVLTKMQKLFVFREYSLKANADADDCLNVAGDPFGNLEADMRNFPNYYWGIYHKPLAPPDQPYHWFIKFFSFEQSCTKTLLPLTRVIFFSITSKKDFSNCCLAGVHKFMKPMPV